eukprot:m.534701 g.534701  ORF g.534701 m.534701 type:complete len:92 (+) comp22059_c0_seq1:483-758(+)
MLHRAKHSRHVDAQTHWVTHPLYTSTHIVGCVVRWVSVQVAAFFVLFMVFYVIQEAQQFCPGCKYIQCYPYTEDFCQNVPGWSDKEGVPPS